MNFMRQNPNQFNTLAWPSWINPSFQRKIVGEYKARWRSDLNIIIDAIEAESPPNLARAITGVVLQCAMISPHNIQRKTVTRPPSDHTGGRWHATVTRLGEELRSDEGQLNKSNAKDWQVMLNEGENLLTRYPCPFRTILTF